MILKQQFLFHLIEWNPECLLCIIGTFDLWQFANTKINEKCLSDSATTRRTIWSIKGLGLFDRTNENRHRNLDLGFFFQFANSTIKHCFVLIEEPTRQCPKSFTRHVASLDQKNMTGLNDDSINSHECRRERSCFPCFLVFPDHIIFFGEDIPVSTNLAARKNNGSHYFSCFKRHYFCRVRRVFSTIVVSKQSLTNISCIDTINIFYFNMILPAREDVQVIARTVFRVTNQTNILCMRYSLVNNLLNRIDPLVVVIWIIRNRNNVKAFPALVVTECAKHILRYVRICGLDHRLTFCERERISNISCSKARTDYYNNLFSLFKCSINNCFVSVMEGLCSCNKHKCIKFFISICHYKNSSYC